MFEFMKKFSYNNKANEVLGQERGPIKFFHMLCTPPPSENEICAGSCLAMVDDDDGIMAETTDERRVSLLLSDLHIMVKHPALVCA